MQLLPDPATTPFKASMTSSLESSESPLIGDSHGRIMKCIIDGNQSLQKQAVIIKEILCEAFQEASAQEASRNLKDTYISLLEITNTQLEKKISSILQQHGILKRKFTELNRTTKKLQIAYTTLATQHTHTGAENSRLNKETQKLAADCQELTVKYTELEATYDELNSEQTALQETAQSLKEKYAQLKGDNEQLKQQTTALKRETSDLSKKYKKLDKRYGLLDEQTLALKTRFEQLSEEYSQLQGIHAEMQKKMQIVPLYQRTLTILGEQLWETVPHPIQVLWNFARTT